MDIQSQPDTATEMAVSTPVEQTEVATPAAETVASPETESVPSQDPQAAIATPATPAYMPNFKFTVKGQEKEIDEMFRTLIKDADTEKKVKELFEKSHGLDSVKEDRAAVKREYEGFKSQIIPHLQTLDQFTKLRDAGNLGAAFKVAAISDEQIFQYAVNLLEMQQNPQMAKLHTSQQDQSLREIQLQRELEHYKYIENQNHARSSQMELDQTLDSHKDLVSQIDSRFGRAGAFKEEVINLGLFELNKGNELSIGAAVEMVANKYKPFLTTNSTPAMPQQNHQRPAIIPNLGNSNVSPVKKKPQSIEDLQKAYKQEVG